MLQLWLYSASIFLEIVTLVQCSDVTDNGCAHAPKLIDQLLDETMKYNYLFVEEDRPDIERRRCCGTYGCFSSAVPFEDETCRKKVRLPFCQDKVKVKFLLWTKENNPNYDVIDPENEETLLQSKMVANSSVIIYINGYLGEGNMPYINLIKDAFLQRKPDVMFISVDWAVASRVYYMRALANTQIVGAITAYFIQQLKKNYNILPENIHIIGINIGAHAAGEVGKRIPCIARITGLDPSGWELQYCDEMHGISMTDANFVDIIHTNSRLFGTPHPKGHLDIYINGAVEQPACMGCFGCNHTIVIFYFLETIKKDLPYLAYQCDNYDNFLKGKCAEGCGNDGSQCAPMGFRAHDWFIHARMSPTLMFMSMGTDESHYHLYHYYVEINCLDDNYRLWRYGRNLDKLEVKLIEGSKSSGWKEIYANSITQNTRATITAIITSKEKIVTLTGVGVRWTPQANKEIPETCEMSDSTNGTITELEKNCLECPFQLKALTIRNLETGEGKRFTDINQRLSPNEELIIGC